MAIKREIGFGYLLPYKGKGITPTLKAQGVIPFYLLRRCQSKQKYSINNNKPKPNRHGNKSIQQYEPGAKTAKPPPRWTTSIKGGSCYMINNQTPFYSNKNSRTACSSIILWCQSWKFLSVFKMLQNYIKIQTIT